MRPREELRAAFAVGDEWFASSPLYRVLAATVVRDDALLDLAAETPAGPQPPNLLMAAAHLVVLRDPSLPFARFFASVVGEGEAAPPEEAAPCFAAFAAEHRDALAATLRTRLVQTNAPGRATAVRLALHAVAQRVARPITFLEVGPSAGIQLRFDRWAVVTGGRRFGPRDAPLVLRTQWRGAGGPPDLDALPPLGRRVGVDLHPVDAADPEERLWLKALVWPEHTDRFAQLEAALDAVAQDPPEILRGDAIDVLPRLDAELPDDVPLVVFHAMVRIHVPPARQPAFDAAIAALGRRRRCFHVALEMPGDGRPSPVLTLRDSAGDAIELALVEGHGRWIEPLPGL